MYTLLSASVIGFDLVRRPAGGPVASLLVDAMALTPEDLPVLAKARSLGALTPTDRSEVADAVTSAAQRSPMVLAMGQMSRLVASGRVSEALQLVESAPMAGLDELLRCLCTDVFDWTWTGQGEERVQSQLAATAVEVVCDALVAAYHAPQLRSVLGERLVEPWAAAQHLLPRRSMSLGPCEAQLVPLLEGLARLDADGWERLTATGREARSQGGWASAMHSATLAVHLSGRVREAAAAQLRGVRVLTDGGVSAGAAAAGVWNLVSGALQATVALDLLDDDTALRLRGPLLGVL
jgi:hypothetical protein